MTGGAHPEGRILGSLHAAGASGVVRMQDRFTANVEDVWIALTDPLRLVRWLGEVDGDLRLGGQFRAHFFASGWEGTGRVEACDPPKRLLVSTRHAKASVEQAIEATLTADGDATILVWEERGMPIDLLAPYGAGVQVHVEDLGAYLDGRERCDADTRFEQLLPAYEELATKIK